MKRMILSAIVLGFFDSAMVITKYLRDTMGASPPMTRVVLETYLASCVIYIPVTLAIFGACHLAFRSPGRRRTVALCVLLTLTSWIVLYIQHGKFLAAFLRSSAVLPLTALLSAVIFLLIVRRMSLRFAAGSLLAAHMACAAFLLVPRSGADRELPRSEKPNVVFILIDAMRYDRLACYGNRENLTPSIDAVARESLVYENAYVHWPTSGPSHSAMFTGKPVYDSRAMNGSPLRTDYTTLAEMLEENGYRTAGFVQNKLLSRANNYDQGFDVFVVDEIEDLKNATPAVLIDRLLPATLYYRLAGRDRFTGEAIRWLEENMAGQPLFLFVQYFHPHIPYTPPGRFIGMKDYRGAITGSLEQSRAIRNGDMQVSAEDIRYMIELYDAEVRYADEQVGLLCEFLRRSGMLENTMLIVTSDHGENLYEHEKFFAHGGELYESTVHTPLVIRYPERRQAGERTGVLMRDIDLMPHILSTCGIDTSGHGLGGAFYVNKDLGILGISCNSERTLLYTKKGDWKYILNIGTKDEELYDIARDPDELVNLSSREPGVCLAFQTAMREEVVENKTISSFLAEGCDDQKHDSRTEEMLRSLGYIE